MLRYRRTGQCERKKILTDTPKFHLLLTRLWDLNTGETLFQFNPDLGALNTAIFGPDESTILTGGQHHSFTMLDINTGRLLARFTGHSEPIMALALHSL